MTRKHRLAFNALRKINAPVYERYDIKNFQISAEHNFDPKYGDTLWADYYDGHTIGSDWEFGVNIVTSTRSTNTATGLTICGRGLSPSQ